MRNIVFLIAFIFCSKSVKSQHKDSQAATYNIVTNAVLGGIGAVINKKPGEIFHKVLLKGMGQGALGGYVVFESKRLVREFSETENYGYLWPSKILNAAGNSITYNAATNRNFWERWHLDFGFNYLEYDFKRKKKLRYRILPFALYGNVNGFVNGNLDLRRTLYAGQFIFKNKMINSTWDFQPLGITKANTIQFDPRFNNFSIEEVLAHEIIHVYQYNDFFASNAFMNKPITNWNQNSSIIRAFHKVFKTDYNYLLFNGLYNMEILLGGEYENLFFEREARYYSPRKF